MALMADDMRVGNEVVQMCVVMEQRSGRLVRGVVHEPSEEPERVRLAQSAWTNDVGELDFERGYLVRELCDRAIEFGLEQQECRPVRQPFSKRLAWLPPNLFSSRAAAGVLS